ncbi:MAG: helix-turn-helix domain-containing protein [Cytophagales bacterium]|jgi:excisionase family DNA binding protein|nr:helix-turn-helix domain-containing protein [Cytophagales bacterium]MCA6365535.1 helix-turn-helix domain-containing protein [Cytophagales bacterium]MCA6373675.1 helix-turn-helix domain-containing protein [Cytophagales bacterium]MCA6374254.1 helix-turn-helix domain-containing protein [Cytophagales bacterium]MCA6383243.1 helix-turn-helix domain-containing protein [Cytophagales bacterium]
MDFYTMIETQNKEYLTIGETRATLGSSRSFVYKLISNGQLSTYKVGRRSYLKSEEIKNLFQKKH